MNIQYFARCNLIFTIVTGEHIYKKYIVKNVIKNFSISEVVFIVDIIFMFEEVSLFEVILIFEVVFIFAVKNLLQVFKC